MITRIDLTKTELCVTALKNACIAVDDIDNLVHDAASGLAEAICNEGMESQVEFLISQGHTLGDILADALLEKEAREASDALDVRRGTMPS